PSAATSPDDGGRSGRTRTRSVSPPDRRARSRSSSSSSGSSESVPCEPYPQEARPYRNRRDHSSSRPATPTGRPASDVRAQPINSGTINGPDGRPLRSWTTVRISDNHTVTSYNYSTPAAAARRAAAASLLAAPTAPLPPG